MRVPDPRFFRLVIRLAKRAQPVHDCPGLRLLEAMIVSLSPYLSSIKMMTRGFAFECRLRVKHYIAVDDADMLNIAIKYALCPALAGSCVCCSARLV
jgi:hypothetical protein